MSVPIPRTGDAPEPSVASPAPPVIPEIPISTTRSTNPRVSPRAGRLLGWMRELMVFGGVGALAFVVDTGLFNVLRASLLADSVVWAKVVSVAVATGVAWLGHRYLTYRRRDKTRVPREVVLFIVANAGGLLIAAACLLVSRDVLGLTSVLADNIAANVVGLALGTAFRFLFYRYLVFRIPTGGDA